MNHVTFYRTTRVDGLSIFYRETGPRDAPTRDSHPLSKMSCEHRIVDIESCLSHGSAA